jgi:hypothetical protein
MLVDSFGLGPVFKGCSELLAIKLAAIDLPDVALIP